MLSSVANSRLFWTVKYTNIGHFFLAMFHPSRASSGIQYTVNSHLLLAHLQSLQNSPQHLLAMWTCQCYIKQFENGSKLVLKPALHWPCERGYIYVIPTILMESTVLQWITRRWESTITCSVVPTNYKVARGGRRGGGGIPNRGQVAIATWPGIIQTKLVQSRVRREDASCLN